LFFSKSDIKKREELNLEEKERVDVFLKGKISVEMSVHSEVNVEEVKKVGCEILLSEKLNKKMNSERINEFMNRIRVIKPFKLRDKEENILLREIVVTEREREVGEENYVFDDRKNYFIEEDWKYDDIPEIFNGKNIADFIDGDIVEKLRLLEEEEEGLVRNGEYNKKYDIFNKEEREYKEAINRRRLEKIVMHGNRRRCSMPERWKNSKKSTRENVGMEAEGAIVKRCKPVDKPQHRERHFDKKPKHIYRSKSKHGANFR
jgi:nucleolar GTP-binding protein